ncbi:MAG: TonB-dependent receptor plug domain-containing protein, partial [Hyphomonadaceae bacterium]|nr:TonB-dependent receptor plug domain-containing protein [Hyphomonadaceae bacterium]
MSKSAALATASCIVVALSMPTVAASQSTDSVETSAPSTTPETSERTLTTVTVTATRREETVQQTGSAVYALDSEALLERSIQSVEDASELVPGLQVSTYQGDTSIFIRGIGTPVIIAGADSSTATYADGMFLSRAAAIGPAFFDVERLEVLRGPQGTLYGRNATGGAVNIITRGPTDDLEAEARLIFGDYNRVQAFGAISGPLSNGLRARLAVQKETRDGYTTVRRAPPLGNFEAEDKDDLTARLTVEADLAPNVMLTIRGDYYAADDKANVF